MEDSKAQDKILALGKAIVKELELDPGVDTLAKWMAHYVAEKIVLAGRLSGDKKKQAEEECFEIISKLWEHRWSIPHNKPFLQDFEPLFDTLDKLNPNKDAAFFMMPQVVLEMDEEIKASETIKTDTVSKDMQDETVTPQTHLDSALRVDKLARFLITDLLNQAVAGLDLTPEREELIRNSIDIIDYPERRIIRIASGTNDYLESRKEDANEAQNRILELRNRLNELEELTSLVKSLVSRYKKELLEIEK